MPINNVQFRAEIGIFYSVLHRSVFKNQHTLLQLFSNCLKTIPLEIGKFFSCGNNLFYSLFIHVLCFFITCLIFPIVIVCALILCNVLNSFIDFPTLYVYVYICLRFIINLFIVPIVYHKAVAKFLTRYCLFFQICIFLPFIERALIIAGDIETNPGPEDLIKQNISLCHWNLNGISTNNYIKMSLLEAYNAVHDFDIICLSETFLNSEYLHDEPRLCLQGYAMIRSDHPSGNKRGGVCIYYKEHIPFVNRRDITFLDECVVGEIRLKNKKCFITCVYRSPSQTQDEMDIFLSNYDKICSSIALEMPFISLVVGDFNAKSTNWWPGGTNNFCGLELFSLNNLLGYTQLINEPTNLEPNKSPSCIDLLFVNQPNLIFESGVHSSLYSMCHHQIIFAKISLKIYFPPPYEREVWHYNLAEAELIKRSVSNFDWKKSFHNQGVNEQVEILNNTLLNIFRNFIPHETVKCKSKDPPWVNKEVKNALRKKNRLYRKYISGGRTENDQTKLNEITVTVSDLITSSKDAYFHRLGERLNDPTTDPKLYWSILKRFLNKIKIPSIPPLLVNNTFITNFAEKANVFNSYFADQCSILSTNSIIPPIITRKTNKSLKDILFTPSDISKIINDLNPNKAHGHDNISIKMIQMCGNTIVTPLQLIFETSIKSGEFPDSWKKGNIIPVHKKECKNSLKNYRPISLLPIFGKIFEKIIYNNLFRYFDENNILTNKQSGFRNGDSCVSQLLAISHEIYKAFDGRPSFETRGIFLDMSKAFDKVWHQGLLYKLKCHGVEDKFYNILENYLFNRKQRVVLNGQSSSWLNVNAGVPQGSVLGPLLFLIYINDLPENLTSSTKLFADDTSIFSTVFDVNRSSEALNQDLSSVKNWATQWKMSFNPDPNKQATEVLFSRKLNPVNHPPLYFNGALVSSSSNQKHLGLILDKKLSFRDHLNEKIQKANKGIGLIKRLYSHVPRKSLLNIYKAYIRPHLDYCDIIYDQPHNITFCNMIESVQYNACLAITGTIKKSSRERLYQELGLESLRDRRWYHRLVFFYKIVNGISPTYLRSFLPEKQRSYNPERSNFYRNISWNTDYFNNTFFPYCIREWNELGPELRSTNSLSLFKKGLLKVGKLSRPKKHSIYNVFDPQGIKLLTHH